jgi:hypothetical protein
MNMPMGWLMSPAIARTRDAGAGLASGGAIADAYGGMSHGGMDPIAVAGAAHDAERYTGHDRRDALAAVFAIDPPADRWAWSGGAFCGERLLPRADWSERAEDNKVRVAGRTRHFGHAARARGRHRHGGRRRTPDGMTRPGMVRRMPGAKAGRHRSPIARELASGRRRLSVERSQERFRRQEVARISQCMRWSPARRHAPHQDCFYATVVIGGKRVRAHFLAPGLRDPDSRRKQ